MAFDADSHAALAALIDYARKAGADASEASFAARESISAEGRMGELEGMEREEGRSVALRAFIGKRQAAASSTDLSPRGLQALADRTVACWGENDYGELGNGMMTPAFTGIPNPVLPIW